MRLSPSNDFDKPDPVSSRAFLTSATHEQIVKSDVAAVARCFV